MSYYRAISNAIRHYNTQNPAVPRPRKITIRADRQAHYYRTHAPRKGGRRKKR